MLHVYSGRPLRKLFTYQPKSGLTPNIPNLRSHPISHDHKQKRTHVAKEKAQPDLKVTSKA